MVLLWLGNVARYQDDPQQATVLYAESLPLAQEHGRKADIASTLVGLADIAGTAGQLERAVRLLSAAEALLDAIGLSVSVWPNVRADYDRNLITIRAQLDEATFAATWAAGRAMPLEQAIAYALEGSDGYPVTSIGTASSTQ